MPEPISMKESDAFRAWLADQDITPSSSTALMIMANPNYAKWVNLGRPGYKVARFSPEWFAEQGKLEGSRFLRGRGLEETLAGFQQGAGVTPSAVAPAIAPTVAPTTEIAKQGGYFETHNGIYGLATYEAGVLVGFEPLIMPDKAGQGAGWRPGELELEREGFGLEREKLEWQKQLASQQIAQSYEDWRRRLLGELTGPGDWITRWMVEQTPEKYPWQPPTNIAGISDIDRSIAEVETAIAQRVSDIRASPEELPGVLPELEGLVNMEKELAGWKKSRAEFVSPTAPPTIESIMKSVAGRTPPAPAWLPEFVPGQRAGRAITKAFVPTPSGQQLTRIPPSQAAGLGGFAEWAGGRTWSDILAHADIMQTRTPAGVGQRRWTPPRQGMV